VAWRVGTESSFGSLTVNGRADRVGNLDLVTERLLAPTGHGQPNADAVRAADVKQRLPEER
jgi:hypothetical protein